MTSLRVHIVCIAAFLALPYLFTPPHPPQAGNNLQDYLILKKIATNCLLVTFFYLNYYVLIPKYFFTRKYVIFGALLLIPGAIVTFSVESLVGTAAGLPTIPLLLRVETNFVLFCATVFVSLALKINNRWQESEKEKVDAELSYLKAQINPHFLFNTLNSIYTLAVKKSDLAPSAIVTLSGMMRYVITEAQTDVVALEKEILYLSNYIELQKIRLGNTAQLSYRFNIPANTAQIAPLLLIPFVENIFKYGVNPEEPSPLRIELALHGCTLTLKTENRIFYHPLSEVGEQSGLGIANVRKRLNLIYPAAHTLDIATTSTNFTVTLTVDL